MTPDAELTAAAASRTFSLLWQVTGVLARADGWIPIPGASAQTLKCALGPIQPFCLSQLVSAPWPSVLPLLPHTHPQELPLLFLGGFTEQSQQQQQTDGFLGQEFCLLLSAFDILAATENRSMSRELQQEHDVRSHTHQGCVESNFATWYSAEKGFQVWPNQVL